MNAILLIAVLAIAGDRAHEAREVVLGDAVWQVAEKDLRTIDIVRLKPPTDYGREITFVRPEGNIRTSNRFTAAGINRLMLVDDSNCFWIRVDIDYGLTADSLAEWYDRSADVMTVGEKYPVSVSVETSRGFKWSGTVEYTGVELAERVAESIPNGDDLARQVPEGLIHEAPLLWSIIRKTKSGPGYHDTIPRLIGLVTRHEDEVEVSLVRSDSSKTVNEERRRLTRPRDCGLADSRQ